MKTKYPIYIPSKGRPNECLTAKALQEADIHFVIVVEPQDYDAYNLNYHEDNLLELNKNDQGLAYARNWIKNHARNNQQEYHWQLDDDVKNFQIRLEGKNQKTNPMYMFTMLETFVEEYENIGITGFRDSVFAWTQIKNMSLNKLNSSVVLVKSTTPTLWRKDIIEDIDYSLQNLYSGQCSAIFNFFLYNKKPNNVAKGGLQDDKLTNYEQININTVKLWPEILKLRVDKKTGKKKLAPSRVWSKFEQTPIKRK